MQEGQLDFLCVCYIDWTFCVLHRLDFLLSLKVHLPEVIENIECSHYQSVDRYPECTVCNQCT